MPSRGMSDFERAVHDVLCDVQWGEVVSYGWVAAQAGRPGAARAVGSYLRNTPDAPNWWRVVGSTGDLVAPSADEQARRLRAEGHDVVGHRLSERPLHPGAASH